MYRLHHVKNRSMHFKYNGFQLKNYQKDKSFLRKKNRMDESKDVLSATTKERAQEAKYKLEIFYTKFVQETIERETR